MTRIVISAHAVHIPDTLPGDLPGGWAQYTPGVPPHDAHLLLGRKGLLGKEPATRLALCAVHRALGLPPGLPDSPPPDAHRTAVVVSSNLGNVATVCDVVSTVRAGSVDDVSPLQIPNASSNVIASSVAIRFGLRGPNFMICNGDSSGLDAVRLAARLLRVGRADRVVVVGVEPDDETARRLRAQGRPPGTTPPLRAAAACLVLTRQTATPKQSHSVVLDRVWSHPTQGEAVDVPIGLRLTAPGGVGPEGHAIAESVDLTERIGDTYGAVGVLQVALAASWLESSDNATGAVVTCGEPAVGRLMSASLRADRTRGGRR
jgi:3-oxoacyl-[acyl-carrier-protein] synthase II